MKTVLFILMVSALVAGLVACEKVDQAIEVLDKVSTLKKDVEKRVGEVKDKTQNLVPAPARTLFKPTNKESGDSDKEGGQGEKDAESKEE